MSAPGSIATSDPRLILLSPKDNVMAVGRKIAAGELIHVRGAEIRIERDLPLGHKIACRSIGIGEKVVKHGAPIGSATQRIEVGEHVHLHNLKSDYTATHTIGAGGETP